MSRTALVLCGGMGTRFASISQKPKILADFRDKVFIDWLIDYLIDHGFNTITFSLGYRCELIVEYISKIKKPVTLKYIAEDTPLGTGGAIKSYFETYRKNNITNEVYVFNGDTFFDKHLPEELFNSNLIGNFTALCQKLSINDRYGDFSINRNKLQIKRGTEREPIQNSKVYCGVARIPNSANFEGLPLKFSTEDLFLNQTQKFTILEYQGTFIDFGVPEAYNNLKSQFDVENNIEQLKR